MAVVNTSRLFVLGTLAEWGPMHGHQIFRLAERSSAELWSTIRASAIYGVLSRLDEEGLIEALRVERPGRFPERTVYGITEQGRGVFHELLSNALRWIPTGGSDPFDVALTVLPVTRFTELAESIEHRMSTLRRELTGFQDTEIELSADPNIPRAAVAIVRHMIHRLQCEIAWLTDLTDMLPELHQEFSNIRHDTTDRRNF
ncbi:PadR family transcriptional regulator [Streptomyces albicerus]|uniref:PadR family transcriptional regulator n=1 Tax=Streptomyces albicerus TaxID=2569859 RepID=UPI001788C9CC|nr:PadR family transcriptional regulator [Streptomyces albicerus]